MLTLAWQGIEQHDHTHRTDRGELMRVRDPVCGVEVEESETVASTQYDGQTFYFCSYACQERFDRNPQRYVSPEAAQH